MQKILQHKINSSDIFFFFIHDVSFKIYNPQRKTERNLVRKIIFEIILIIQYFPNTLFIH